MKWHRIISDQTAGARAVEVVCFSCGKMLRMSDALIDTKGPAYQGYYHRDCLPSGLKNEEITTLVSTVGRSSHVSFNLKKED